MPISMEEKVYPRPLHWIDKGDSHFAVDPARPNWAAINDAGATLLRELALPTSVAELVQNYQASHSSDEPSKAKEEVVGFLEQAVDAQLLSLKAVEELPYEGRSKILKQTSLEEFWIQINDFCNLSCEHCLVSSSPEGGHGLPAETVRDALQQALDLGVQMVGITGGEPFFREDIFDLYELILSDPARSVTTLTNGTRLRGKTLEKLKQVGNKRLGLRISLDGPTPEVNDPIRGKGSFKAAVRGIRNALETDCAVTMTMALNGANAAYADQMPKLVKELGVDRLHVLWPFQRGRAIEEGQNDDLTPSVDRLIDGYRNIRAAALEAGITFFTYESWKVRIDGPPGLKYDLANHCWSSLCLYTDGNVFPSPALTQHPELSLGNVATSTLRDLWHDSDVAHRFRETTVTDRPQCRECHYRFMCGGGDMDHIYNTSRMHHRERGDLLADDPYCDLYKAILGDAMFDLSASSERRGNGNGGAPRLVRSMGHRPNKPPQQLTQGEATLATVPST